MPTQRRRSHEGDPSSLAGAPSALSAQAIQAEGLGYMSAGSIPLTHGLVGSRVPGHDRMTSHLGLGLSPKAAGLSLVNHPSNSVVGLTSHAAAQFPGMTQLDMLRLNAMRQMSEFDLMRAAASTAQPGLAQPWRLLPHGAYQQPSQPANLGMFPIAPPYPMAGAGYQLGSMPSSMAHRVSNPSDTLQQALLAAEEDQRKRKAGDQEQNEYE